MSWSPGERNAGGPVGVVADVVLAFEAEPVAERQVGFPSPIVLIEEGSVEDESAGEGIVDDGDLIALGRACRVLRQGLEDVVAVVSGSGVVGGSIGAQTRAETQSVGAGGSGGVVLKLEYVLMIADYARVIASVDEGALNGDGGSREVGDLIVADSAPLEEGLVD